jgi:hypothetical protein
MADEAGQDLIPPLPHGEERPGEALLAFMKTKFIVVLAGLFALILFVLVFPTRAFAAWGTGGSPVGANCTIQFRRDALGTAASSPVPPLTGMHNGADTCVAGKVKSLNNEWLVVDAGNKDLWIATSAVLLIQVNHTGSP